MNNAAFKQITEKQLLECIETMRLKGADYPMDTSDRLSNFKHSAKRSGTQPLQAWLVFFLKHEECIEKYVRGEYHDSEPIFGRITDAINYLILLRALIEETSQPEPRAPWSEDGKQFLVQGPQSLEPPNPHDTETKSPSHIDSLLNLFRPSRGTSGPGPELS